MNRQEAREAALKAFSEYYDYVPFKQGERREELKQAYAILAKGD
jgi:hypothetical protein